jgi:adenosine deaminase
MKAIDQKSTIARYSRSLPKAELHLHLEGSLRPQLLLRLADRNRLRIPFSHQDDFDRIYHYRNFRDFANALLFGVGCLRRPEDFFDAVGDLGAMLVEQNVRYAEVTWTPQFYLDRGCSLDDLLDAMNMARHTLQRRTGLVMRWIPDLVRSYPNPATLVAEWASSARAREGGVVALGLGGPEAGHPATTFKKIFALARASKLPANPHAGEGDGPASIWATIKSLRPARIGHGVRAIEDSELVNYLAREGIPLEVSLTSNIVLGTFQNYETHPIKRLIEAGCVVTLNTDDPVLFRTSLSNEYVKAIKHCGLELQDIRRAILSALRVSYLGNEEKVKMIAAFQAEFDRLGSEL